MTTTIELNSETCARVIVSDLESQITPYEQVIIFDSKGEFCRLSRRSALGKAVFAHARKNMLEVPEDAEYKLNFETMWVSPEWMEKFG